MELTLQSNCARIPSIASYVAILILLELTLQCEFSDLNKNVFECRNPYFIGINSAMFNLLEDKNNLVYVAILILLELTLQLLCEMQGNYGECCRNPYFIGINSAID